MNHFNERSKLQQSKIFINKVTKPNTEELGEKDLS